MQYLRILHAYTYSLFDENFVSAVLHTFVFLFINKNTNHLSVYVLRKLHCRMLNCQSKVIKSVKQTRISDKNLIFTFRCRYNFLTHEILIINNNFFSFIYLDTRYSIQHKCTFSHIDSKSTCGIFLIRADSESYIPELLVLIHCHNFIFKPKFTY